MNLWNTEYLTERRDLHFLSPGMVESLVRETRGKFFQITFLKRSNNEVRTMTARTGVKTPTIKARAEKYADLWAEYHRQLNLPPGDEEKLSEARLKVLKEINALERGESRAPYDPADHGLITVWDCDKGQYRNISLECVLEVRANGLRVNAICSSIWKRKHIRTRLRAGTYA